MKKLHLFTILIFILCASLFLFSCSGDDDDDSGNSPADDDTDADDDDASEWSPSVTGTAVVADNAKVIEPEQGDQGEIEDDALTFPKDGNGNLLELEVGDVIGSAGENAFLRKVEDVYEEGDAIIILTGRATLEDVFEEADFVIELDFTDTKAGGAWLDEDFGGTNIYTGDVLGVPVTLDITQGHLYFAPSFRLHYIVGTPLISPTMLDFSVSALLEAGIEVQAQIGGTVPLFNKETEIEIFKTHIPILVAGWPIDITPSINIVLGVEGAVTAQTTVTAGARLESDSAAWNDLFGNVRYYSDDDPEWSFSETHAFDWGVYGPELDGQASGYIKAYARLEVEIQLYDAAGPYVQVGPTGKLGLEVTPDCSWNIYAGAEGEIGANVEMFGWDIYDYSTDLFNYETSIANGDCGGDDDDDDNTCTGCEIGTTCYADQDENPTNPCEWCDTAQSTTGWSDNDSGSCDDNQYCTGAESCSGGQCNSAGDPCTASQTCNESLDSCEDDCTGCEIGATCYANQDENPTNTCEWCDTAQSTTGWSDNDSGSCDDGLFCTGAESCNSGQCGSAGDPCTASQTCNEPTGACDDIADDDDDVTDDDDDDYTDMVQIPAGNFWMGCEPNDTQCLSDESPRHQVNLSSYYINVYEVTNSRYVGFLNANGNLCDGYECVDASGYYLRLSEIGGVWSVDTGYEDHPLVEVSWYGAKAFCEWTGGRLPTEAEWEKAAKGATEHYIYPYGDTWVANAANWGNSGDPYDNGTTPVGYYDGSMQGAYQTTDGRSPYGVHDMAGNVIEWVNDWWDPGYYSTNPSTDPLGPATGLGRVMRGGGWINNVYFLDASHRNWYYPNTVHHSLGFRCSRD